MRFILREDTGIHQLAVTTNYKTKPITTFYIPSGNFVTKIHYGRIKKQITFHRDVTFLKIKLN